MFSSRRIPKIGGALLVLGGCSDGDTTLIDVAESLCRRDDACSLEYFASVAECTADNLARLESSADWWESQYGAVCREAFVDFTACREAALVGCGVGPEDQAEIERCYDAALAACPAYGSGYGGNYGYYSYYPDPYYTCFFDEYGEYYYCCVYDPNSGYLSCDVVI